MAEEIYNVIELKVGSVKILNDHCLSINGIEFNFLSSNYTSEEGALIIIEKEEKFNKNDTFGEYLSVFGWTDKRIVYVKDTNKLIFNTDVDNLEDIILDSFEPIDVYAPAGYISDLVDIATKVCTKPFKLAFSTWTEASGMALEYYKFTGDELLSKNQEQDESIIKIYNSEHGLKDEIIDIAKEAGYEPDRMTFKQWVYGESPLGFEGKELTEEEEAEVWAKKDDYCVEGVEVYRPIYDYTCNDPTIIAPDWW